MAISARGLAVGDFDNDGAVDVLISVNGGAPVLLRNNAGKQNHWLGVNLVGKKSNPDAIGARVAYQAGDLKRSHMKVGGGSYLSAHDPRMVLGLGTRRKIDWLEVKWPQPSGLVERFTDLPHRSLHHDRGRAGKVEVRLSLAFFAQGKTGHRLATNRLSGWTGVRGRQFRKSGTTNSVKAFAVPGPKKRSRLAPAPHNEPKRTIP